MLITTQDQLEEYHIKRTLGRVQGSTIRARHIGTDILAGLRNIVGGEVHEYTKILENQHPQLYEFMLKHKASFVNFFKLHNNALLTLNEEVI